MKAQTGNVIFVMLTPARDCCVTPLFSAHHLLLHAGEHAGGERGRGEEEEMEMVFAAVTAADVVPGADSRAGVNLLELRIRG